MEQSLLNRPVAGHCEHTLEEWEVYREIFTQLYVVEDKPLSEVKADMAYLYGFYATERQYKRKVALWKLDKYFREADMKVVLRKRLKRKLEDGKESEFIVNGRRVSPAKIARFMQRKDVAQQTILDEQMKTPCYISCNTPSSSRGDSKANSEEVYSPDDVLSNSDRMRGVQAESTNSVPAVAKGVNTLAAAISQSTPPSENAESSSLSPKAASMLQVQGAEAESPGTVCDTSSEHNDISIPSIPPPVTTSQSDSADGSKINEWVDFVAKMVSFLWRGSRLSFMFADGWSLLMKADLQPLTPSPTPSFIMSVRSMLSKLRPSTRDIEEALLLIHRARTIGHGLQAKPGSWNEYDHWTETDILAITLGFNEDVFGTPNGYETAMSTRAQLAGYSQDKFTQMKWDFQADADFDMFVPELKYQEWRGRLYKLWAYVERSLGRKTPTYPAMIHKLLHDRGGREVSVEEMKPFHLSDMVASTTNTGRFVISNANETAATPFERCSPRYHLSSSPDWYRQDITPRNPLHHLTPFPIQSSSPAPTPHTLIPETSTYGIIPTSLDPPNERPEASHQGWVKLPPLRRHLVDLSLDWPPMSDEDAITC